MLTVSDPNTYAYFLPEVYGPDEEESGQTPAAPSSGITWASLRPRSLVERILDKRFFQDELYAQSWPQVVRVYKNDKPLGDFNVDMETVPSFTVRAVKEGGPGGR